MQTVATYQIRRHVDAADRALHDLLQALGLDAARAIATMLSSLEAREANHGSVIVTVAGAL